MGEQIGFDIAAAHDGDGALEGQQLGGVEEQGSCGDGAAGLGGEARVEEEAAHGGADFVFRNGDDVVDVGADVLEKERSAPLRRSATRPGIAPPVV